MPIPQSTWSVLGYRSTPYSTEQIPTDDNGEGLLVGRQSELNAIHRKFVDGVQLVALEGNFGVGKSSLAAVAAHQASKWHEESTDHFFLPAIGTSPLELREEYTFADFEKQVYYRIAAAILKIADRLTADGYELNRLEDFRAWLQQPAALSWSVGIGASLAAVAGANLNVGKGRTFNSASGFSDAGVIELINGWIAEIFSNRKASGVICVLDNLETLSGFEDATTLFESLRDSLFRRKGLVWIVCGAEGMVRTAFSTKKMAGVFHEPIDVEPLPAAEIPNVIEARARFLRTREDARLPVTAAAFGRMYEATGQNLRFALGVADSYAGLISPTAVVDMSDEEKDAEFEAYLATLGDRVVSDLDKKVSKADWKVLRTLLQAKSGTCSPSEFADFGYADMPPLITRVNALKQVGLVTYSVVKTDGRRRLISATENGRLAMLGSKSAA